MYKTHHVILIVSVMQVVQVAFKLMIKLGKNYILPKRQWPSIDTLLIMSIALWADPQIGILTGLLIHWAQ